MFKKIFQKENYMESEKIKETVRKTYSSIVTGEKTSCGCGCGSSSGSGMISQKIGYDAKELSSVPKDADYGLGCGNPTAFASLKSGETVLDLGSGPGLDCFIAANKVGPDGKVIGVDMTPAMISKARENSEKNGYKNVEFRLGEIENLPVENNSVDVIISNCVINLVPDKTKAFSESFRVLKPGGRLMVSDIVLREALPEAVLKSVDAYSACVSGAEIKEKYLEKIKDAGFIDVEVVKEIPFTVDLVSFIGDRGCCSADSIEKSLNYNGIVKSISVSAFKPVK